MKKLISILNKTVLFRGFSNEEIEKALACLKATAQTYSKKEVIFREDEPLRSVGIVLKGEVSLSKKDMHGMLAIFSVQSKGELLGETALQFGEEKSGYETLAIGECDILFIQMQQIVRPYLPTCPLRGKMIENLLSLIVVNNRSLYQKLGIVSHRSLRQRILHYLELEAKRNNSFSFKIPLSRTDLADYLTVDRSALSRELGRMEKEGLILFSRNQFQLCVKALDLLKESSPFTVAAPKHSSLSKN